MRIVLIIWVCLALALPAYAAIYKWTDKNGKIHYTNDPSQIPVDQRNKKSMKKMTSEKRSAPKTSNSAPKPAPETIDTPSHDPGLDTNEVKRLRRLMQK